MNGDHILWHLRRIDAKLDALRMLLIATEGITMATLDDVITEVTAQTTLIASVKTLVDGLRKQLADAIASGDPAKVQAVLDGLTANDAAVNAILANTP